MFAGKNSNLSWSQIKDLDANGEKYTILYCQKNVAMILCLLVEEYKSKSVFFLQGRIVFHF